MSIVVDPNFSVYRLVERSRQASIVLRKRHEMTQLSYRIEEHLLKDDVSGVLFASFQYLSRFEKRRDVYAQVAQSIDHVYVFAYPDVPDPEIPNLTVVPISEQDLLIHEWFVVFHGPDYYSAIVAREDGTEEFKSLWTFDEDIISILSDWLMSLLDSRELHLKNAPKHNPKRSAEFMDDAVDFYLEISDDS